MELLLSINKGAKAIALALSLAVLTSGCMGGGGDGGSSAAGGSPGSGSSAVSGAGYFGSGSDWRWSLNNDGSFSAHESTSSTDVSGTYVRLSSGFLKLTITAASGGSAPSVGEQAYALEIPGVALLVKPILGFEHEIITLVAHGNCPTSDISGNWIHTQHRIGGDMTRIDQDSFGVFNYDFASSTATLPERYAIQGFTSMGANNAPMAGQCQDGVMTVIDNGGETVKMYLTQVGGALVKFQNSNEAALVLPKQHIADQTSIAGNYAALLFDANNAVDDLRIRPMSLAIAANGQSLSAQGLLDVETAQPDPSVGATVALGAVNQPSDGFVEATVTAQSGNTGAASCMVVINAVNTGKNVLFCVGQSPDNHSQPYNVLAVSK